jgi:hypothetical protein
MSQATTLLDAADHPAFTIFREQRIDVPLSRVSRNSCRRFSPSKISGSTTMPASTSFVWRVLR